MKSKNWTKEEVEFLMNNYQKMQLTQIAEKLGRPYNGVFLKMRSLGLKRGKGKKPKAKSPA